MSEMVLDEALEELKHCINPGRCQRFEVAVDFAAEVLEALSATPGKNTPEEPPAPQGDALFPETRLEETSEGTREEA